MNAVISKLARTRCAPGVWIAVASVSLALCTSCSKEKKANPAVASASARASTLPANVEPQLLSKLTELAKTCTLDLRESKVECKDRGLEAVSEQIVQGARSQSKALDTVAYALAQPDEKLQTVAAELLHMAFRAPVEEKNPQVTSKETALSLIESLAKLPAQQAVDAAPATVYAAFKTGTDKELYAAIDNHAYKRLASRAYRYLMAAGGMKGLGKAMELAKSEPLELALAGIEAPTLMREKTPEQRARICDWYKTLVDDSRRVVATRASGYLIVCGPVYIEQLLVVDEERVKDTALTKLPLGSYQQMCAPSMVSVTGPTPEQCGRLKKLLTTVLEGNNFEPLTRVEALTLLTANFPDKEVLALVKKYSKHAQPLLSSRAADAAQQITAALAAPKKAPGLDPESGIVPASDKVNTEAAQ